MLEDDLGKFKYGAINAATRFVSYTRLPNGFTRPRVGFTLIELLVVIAIIAVLSIVVILTLNPAELLKQARDSNRISDLSTLRSAVSLYLSDVNSPNITGATANCYTSAATSSGSSICEGYFTGIVTATSSKSGNFTNAGNGWIPINFTSISSGAPIGSLPRDPTNVISGVSSTDLFYAYTASSTGLVFEIDAYMESSKYSASGPADVVSKDGGNRNDLYEVGTKLNI